VCRWIERNLVHGEGDFYGRPFRLLPSQKRFIYRAYELRPDGRRRYSRVLKGMPKGFGKTELGAAIACYELGGGDTAAPVIPVAAASFDQADLAFGAMRTMLGEGPLADFFDIFDTEIQVRGGPGRAYRVAAAAGTNDGARPTFVLDDELHEWVGGKERVHLVLSNGLAKRVGGWELNITTAGSDLESLLGQMYTRGKRIQAGELADDSFLFDWSEASDQIDISTDEGLREAILSCGDSADVTFSVDDVIRRFREIPEYEGRRYFLNQWTSTAEQWLPTGAWPDRANPQLKVADGTPIVLGFDGSYNNDSTALVASTLAGHLFVVGLWEKPERDDDWIVPRSEVDNVVAETFRRYKVLRMPCDPPGWHREIERWMETYGDDVVIHWPTNQRVRMIEACSRFYSAVMRAALSHDADPRLARHIANAVVKETPDGAYITKPVRNSSKKIDAAVAAVIAYEQASVLADARPQRPAQLITF
jgi:phage terminase large subunit-like protein